MAGKRQGGGFGFIMLLVVVVVVLFLTARAWKSAAPAMMQLDEPETVVDDHGQPEARDALTGLPKINDVLKTTDVHAEQLAEALAKTE